MTSNNSEWIYGAPKEAIPCIWQPTKDSRPWTWGKDLCAAAIKDQAPCYRHRPIKKEEK